MKKSNIKKSSNASQLTRQQKNALDYWNGATNQLEKTSRSVLDLYRRNNDNQNYTKYRHQYEDFRRTRGTLTEAVHNAIQSNDMKRIEGVISEAVQKLKEKIYLRNTQSKKHQLRSSMSEEYDVALLALKRCMEQVRKKLLIVDKCLNRLSAEMTLYSALGKELQSLMESTVQAKKDKRERIAGAVIALAPEVMSYIQTQ